MFERVLIKLLEVVRLKRQKDRKEILIYLESIDLLSVIEDLFRQIFRSFALISKT